MIVGLTGILSFTANAQDDNGIIRQERKLPSFTGIRVGGAFEVFLSQGEIQKVEVETSARFIDNVDTEVKDETLAISSRGLKSIKELNVYITVPELKSIEASGAAEVKGRNTINADHLSISSSGAAEIALTISVDDLQTDLSGASEMKLDGTATSHTSDVSGASSLNASNLKTDNSHMTVSGAASAHINAAKEIIGDVSGAGNLDYNGNAENRNIEVNKSSSYTVHSDSVRVKVGGMEVEVKESPDTIRIRSGNRVVIVDGDGNIKYKKCKKYKFNGHWAGFDIGLNGYVNDNYNMNFPKEYEYLDLRMEKSITVGLNFFEQNIRLAKNQKWGMLTGLGLGFNNYRFLRPARLSMDSSALQGYLHEGISVRKSKLTVMYLTLPLLFEYQTNPWCNKTSFHLGLGMIMSTRLTSHTKVYYNEYNKEFTLKQYDPETGQYVDAFTDISPNYAKVKNFGDWFLNPFKFDATVRIGWGVINLFATFSVNSLFRDGKGPELYPWSAGISLVSF